MPTGGNLIARSLALVAIGTAGAFVNWSFQPIAGLASPKGRTDPAKATPGDPPEPGADPGPAVQNDPGTPQAGAPSAAFDASQLDTNIHTADTFQLWQSGTVVFIDARPAHEYEAGHIPFAFLVPSESLDAGRLGDMVDPSIGGITPDQRVVVYCEGGLCTASELVAYRLQDMGFTKIHIDVDGYPGWQAAGYEVQTGADPVLGEIQ
ncbi:MAG: hypothetical protein IPJ41_06110 [Phycisphaerales bacterium]|nr:hypothetical protein [Phycisphaerales bacterium]